MGVSEQRIAGAAGAALVRHGLHGWRFAWRDDLGRLAGYCDWDSRLILGNRRILTGTRLVNVRETVLHEIAHALTPADRVHGDEWYMTLLGIGGSGAWRSADGVLRMVRAAKGNLGR